MQIIGNGFLAHNLADTLADRHSEVTAVAARERVRAASPRPVCFVGVTRTSGVERVESVTAEP